VEFFWVGHGKWPHDGAKALLKRFLKKSWLDVNEPKLQNVEDVGTLLCTHLFSQPETFYTGERKLVTFVFWHVNTIDVDRQTKYTCDFVMGS
jgi:hypothetical protein